MVSSELATSDFSMTEILTTAGNTFFTIGAKLGICTIAGCADCASASGAPDSTADSAPTNATWRSQPPDIIENLMDQPRVKMCRHHKRRRGAKGSSATVHDPKTPPPWPRTDYAVPSLQLIRFNVVSAGCARRMRSTDIKRGRGSVCTSSPSRTGTEHCAVYAPRAL